MTTWRIREELVHFGQENEIFVCKLPSGSEILAVFTAANAAKEIGISYKFPVLDVPKQQHTFRFVNTNWGDANSKLAYSPDEETLVGFVSFGTMILCRVYVFHKNV